MRKQFAFFFGMNSYHIVLDMLVLVRYTRLSCMEVLYRVLAHKLNATVFK